MLEVTKRNIISRSEMNDAGFESKVAINVIDVVKPENA